MIRTPGPLACLCALFAAGGGCATTGGAPAPIPLREEHQELELVAVRHEVKAGQNLFRIAKAYGLTVEELREYNGLSDPRGLAVGQVLTIPGASAPRPVEGPGGGEAPEEAPEEAAATPAGRVPTQAQAPRPGTLAWPLRGVLYAKFGKKGREPHDGIDLAAPEGTPVKTAGPGTVLFAGEQKGYGQICIIEHPAGLVTLYAHNRDLRVKTGQQVRDGQVVATVGQSGATSGPHLHFEVRKAGRPVDPLEHLGPIPGR